MVYSSSKPSGGCLARHRYGSDGEGRGGPEFGSLDTVKAEADGERIRWGPRRSNCHSSADVLPTPPADPQPEPEGGGNQSQGPEVVLYMYCYVWCACLYCLYL